MLRLLIAGATAVAAQEVLVLTDSNYAETIEKHQDGILVEFYAPWCGHCKRLEPEFNKAAKALDDAGIKIPLAKVDATVETKIASEKGVQGYPTLKWVVGGEDSEYDGPREADGIVDWIKSMTGPAVIEEEAPADEKFAITLIAPALEDAFQAVAKRNRKKAKWYYVKGSDKKVTLKHLGEDAAECTDITEDGITKCYKDNQFPLYGNLDGDTFGQYMESGSGMVWTLLPMTADTKKDTVEKSRASMTEVAKKLQGKFYVSWTDTAEFGKILESMFGVTEFPKILVQKKMGDKKNYVYDGEHTTEKIMEYINKVESGEITPSLKSEDIPEKNDEPVKIVVGKNLEEEVFHAEKDVLLEVYAPWCGHCKKLDPEYTKVAKKVKKEGFEDILTIAKMDGTLNDSPVDTISWSGFPTIVYVKAGSTEVMKYDGARDAKGIWKWIKKNHSKADKIKETLAAKQKEDKKEEL